jgi:hypothetical protein
VPTSPVRPRTRTSSPRPTSATRCARS